MDDAIVFLNELSWAFRASKVLHVSVKLGVFSILSEKELALSDICERCGSKPELTEKLLIACCSLGLLERHDDLFANTELSETYLVEGKEFYQGNIILHSARTGKFWDELGDNIYADRPPADDEAKGHRDFIMGMHNITVTGRGQMFLESIDLSGRKNLLDVGGGPGTYSIIACRKYPELRATVFDVPATIAIAKEMIAKEGMQERVQVVEGDWEADEFGADFDVVLMSNILHGAGSNARMKLDKAYRAMEPGGLLAVQEFLLDDDKGGPLIPSLFNVMVGAFSKKKLINLIFEAGFKEAQLVISDQSCGNSWIRAGKSG